MIRTLLGVGAAALIALPGQPVATQSTPPAQTAAPQSEGAKLAALFRDSDEANPPPQSRRRDLPRRSSLRRPPRRLLQRRLFRGANAPPREADLAALAQIDRAEADATDKIAYDVFKYQQDSRSRGDRRAEMLALDVVRPINHFSGFHTFYPAFASGQGAAPFKTVEDYENNLKRHRQFCPLLDRAIGRFRQGMASGCRRDQADDPKRHRAARTCSSAQKPEESPLLRTGPRSFRSRVLRGRPGAPWRRLSGVDPRTRSIPPTAGCAISCRTNICRKAREGVGLVHMQGGAGSTSA